MELLWWRRSVVVLKERTVASLMKMVVSLPLRFPYPRFLPSLISFFLFSILFLLLPSSSFYFCSFLPLVDPLSLWSQKQSPPLCFILFVLPLCCLLFLSFVSQTNLPPQKQYVPPLNLSFASLFSKKIDHLFV